jgi:hypothetical protein
LYGERDCFAWLHKHMARQRLSSRSAQAQRWLALKWKLRLKLGPAQPYAGHPIWTGASQQSFTPASVIWVDGQNEYSSQTKSWESKGLGLERLNYATSTSLNTNTPRPQAYNLLFSTLLNNTSLSGYGSTVILFNGFSSLAR